MLPIRAAKRAKISIMTARSAGKAFICPAPTSSCSGCRWRRRKSKAAAMPRLPVSNSANGWDAPISTGGRAKPWFSASRKALPAKAISANAAKARRARCLTLMSRLWRKCAGACKHPAGYFSLPTPISVRSGRGCCRAGRLPRSKK